MRDAVAKKVEAACKQFEEMHAGRPAHGDWAKVVTAVLDVILESVEIAPSTFVGDSLILWVVRRTLNTLTMP